MGVASTDPPPPPRSCAQVVLPRSSRSPGSTPPHSLRRGMAGASAGPSGRTPPQKGSIDGTPKILPRLTPEPRR